MRMSFLDIQAFVHREARLLDDRQWDEWLACYSKSAMFWMQTWDDDDTLVEDLQSEISLIYYPNREGLEDRIRRIKTERSGATSGDSGAGRYLPWTCAARAALPY